MLARMSVSVAVRGRQPRSPSSSEGVEGVCKRQSGHRLRLPGIEPACSIAWPLPSLEPPSTSKSPSE